MRLKLDENLGTRGVALLRDAGHEVATVSEEGLSGSTDRALIEQCRAEDRCLVTLDLEFGNPLVFKPSGYPGIVALRLPPNPGLGDLLDALRTLSRALTTSPVAGRLWIVQRGRIREYQEETEPA